MSCTSIRTMLPTTSPETARPPYQYSRPTGPSSYNGQSYGYSQRSAVELPRPLEPRPLLQTSLSESSGSQRQHDTFRGAPHSSLDYRSSSQVLPGLKDILTSDSRAPSQGSYSAPWPPHHSHPAQAPEPYRQTGIWHPPLSLHPSTESNHPYSNARRVDLPVLESSPVARHSANSLPVSPYTGYSDARNYAEARPDRSSQPSASYSSNGIPSPYGSASEESQYRGIGPHGHQRSGEHPLQGLSAEAQRKYLGVKDVPGEGAYHVYEGGFRIPTHVDGETVNPAWGLTKANKPRKRLALACLDCREKKIKCEPGASSCLQCEKAKRPCRKYGLR
jgi:hypothetical protein